MVQWKDLPKAACEWCGILQLIESVVFTESPEASFEIVDHSAGSERITPVNRDTCSEVDVMVDKRLLMFRICKV